MSQPALPPRIANIPPGPPTPHNQVFLNMPVLRPAYLRPDVTHRTNRSEKAAATFAHRVGRQRTPQCHGCQAGRGPFTTCVTANGHFGGACTNCKYTSASTSCSLRPPLASAPPALPVSMAAPLGLAPPVVAVAPVAVAAFVGLPTVSSPAAPAAPHQPPLPTSSDLVFLALLDPRLFLPFDPQAPLEPFAP